MSSGSAPAPHPGWAPGFGAWVLRTRSTDGLELLGRWAASDPTGWAGEYARCLALVPGADGPDLLAALAAVPGSAATAASRYLHGQILLRHGDEASARGVLEAAGLGDADAWALETDLANPFRRPAGALDRDAWLERLGEPFRVAGLEAPTLDDSLSGPDGSPFSWLRARPTSVADGSDLVTVVVSAYRPGPDLLMAVRSLADQSWEALDIVVVDDASGPQADDMLERAAALDPRVRVVRATRNAGTYAARNLALGDARGRYVTFHDFDDWAHPRRVEHQVAALDNRRIASRSGCLRAYPDLSLTFPGYPAARLNASSLLVEREPAVELVGGFHLVRKSADMEYPGRLRAARPGSVRDLPVQVPLAITQLRPGSLSRTDAVPGWTRWNRIAYRDAYREWHRRIAVGTASPYLPVRHDAAGRRGPMPPSRSFSALGDRGPAAGVPFDVVLLADLRTDHVTLRRAAAELTTLAARGARVGVAHVDPPVRPRPSPGSLNRSIARLVNDGTVQWADPGSAIAVSTVVVLDPPALLLRGPLPVAWQVSRTLLCVRSARDLVADVPAGRGGCDPGPIVAAAEAALSAPVTWRALSGDGWDLVREHRLPGPGLLPWIVGPGTGPRRPPGDGLPRIGHGALEPAAWEVPADVLQRTFGTGIDVDVRFAQGRGGARAAFGGSPPAGWLFLDDVDAAADLGFAGTLDVMVLPRTGPDGVAAAREALVAGTPVVLHRADRPVVEREGPDLVDLVTWADSPPGLDMLRECAAAGARRSASELSALVADRIGLVFPDNPPGG